MKDLSQRLRESSTVIHHEAANVIDDADATIERLQKEVDLMRPVVEATQNAKSMYIRSRGMTMTGRLNAMFNIINTALKKYDEERR